MSASRQQYHKKAGILPAFLLKKRYPGKPSDALLCQDKMIGAADACLRQKALKS